MAKRTQDRQQTKTHGRNLLALVALREEVTMVNGITAEANKLLLRRLLLLKLALCAQRQMDDERRQDKQLLPGNQIVLAICIE